GRPCRCFSHDCLLVSVSDFHLCAQGLPQHDESCQDQHTPCHASHQITTGDNFLHQHERCDSCYPYQIHHPRHKQQGHEEPATSHAVQAVSQPHDEGAA